MGADRGALNRSDRLREWPFVVVVMTALVGLYVVAELYTIVKVAEAFGVLDAVALLIVVSMLGAALAKRQGIHVLRRLQTTVAEGRVPSAEIVDGFLVLVAAFLMILPGFLSDGVALLLLLPPIRALARERSRRGRTPPLDRCIVEAAVANW